MRHDVITKCLFAVCALLVCSLKAAVLYENGEVKSSIVIAETASTPVRQAAHELAHWLKSATGREWFIGYEPKDGLLPIYLGDSEFARAHGFDRDALKSDGYLLKVTDEYLLLAGRDYPGGMLEGLIQPLTAEFCWSPELELNAFGEMGTFNGVERFLEKYVGIRFYMVGYSGTVVPPCSILTVPEQETTDAPDFEYRHPWFCNFRDSLPDALWYRRVGFGAKAPICVNHSYMNMQWYRDSRPDFFAIIDGKPDFDRRSVQMGGGNYCLTNPDLIQTWVDTICNFFESNPQQDLYPLCPNDGLDRICECEACQALRSPELGERGEFSNYVWSFTDRVAREVAKRCPGKMIGTFAYEKYWIPPTKPAELAPNVAVMICYNRFQLNDPAMKAKVRANIEQWSKRCANVYFWTYQITDYMPPWQGMPVCYPHLLAEDIRANYALKTKGEFIESEFTPEPSQFFHYWRINLPAMSHLNTYVLAKLLWDANTDVDALLDEYYHLFYGGAADVMKRFWEKAEQIALSRPFLWGISTPMKFFTRDDAQEFLDLLDEAQAKEPYGTQAYFHIGAIRGEMKPYMDNLLNASAAMRTLSLPLMNAPLAFDDKLDCSEWNESAAYDFTAKDGSPSPYPTRLKAMADNDGLTLEITSKEPHMAEVVAACHDRDEGDIWRDDCIEFFFVKQDGTANRHFMVTSRNVIWDSVWEGEDGAEDSSWNSACVSYAEKSADSWTVRIFIPWQDLDVTPETIGQLRTNIYRNRIRNEVPCYMSFSPCQALPHRSPDYFVNLKFK